MPEDDLLARIQRLEDCLALPNALASASDPAAALELARVSRELQRAQYRCLHLSSAYIRLVDEVAGLKHHLHQQQQQQQQQQQPQAPNKPSPQ